MKTQNKKTKEQDVIWPIRMKESLKKQFKEVCDKHGYSMSKRIKVLIQEEINQNI